MREGAAILRKHLHWLAFLLFLMACFPSAANGQESAATLTGTVEDSTGACIVGAGVQLINVQTGTENDSATNEEGSFLLPGIIPGRYVLRIERTGFATTQVNGIRLNIGDTKSLLIRMKVGSVLESMIVDGSGQSLNTTDAAVSTVVDQKFVSSIPLNGRSFQDLISLTPGIVTQNPQAGGQGAQTQGEFGVNGQRPESNSFFVDGVSANYSLGLTSGSSGISNNGANAGSTALGTTQTLVSVDALQEFRVLTSTYSAEYGRTPGGQFTFLTRSGTNTPHGSLYEHWRHYNQDATDWFSYGVGDTYNQDDSGGTLSAPLVIPGIYNGRDKTFVFLSYENLYLTQLSPYATLYTVAPCLPYPAPCFIPTSLQAVLNTFPDYLYNPIINPAGNPTGLGVAFNPISKWPAEVSSTSIRLDQIFSPRFSMFFRYGGTPSRAQMIQLSSLTTTHANTQTFTLGAAGQFSATLNDEFRLGYAGSDLNLNTSTDVLPCCRNPLPNLNPALGIPASEGSVRGQAYVHIVGVGDTSSNTDDSATSLRQWNLRDTLSFQKGPHLLKLGLDERHLVSTVTPAALSVEADFFDLASILNNSASEIVITKSTPATPMFNEFSAFVQDEWKVSKKLNLSLGLRWDVNPAPKGKDGQDAFTVLGNLNSPATLQLAPRGTPLWHTSWYNLAPRLGAAWLENDKPGKELVLRAGAGMFFDTATQAGLRAFDGVGFAASSSFANAPLPITPSQLTFPTAVTPPYTNITAFAFPSHLQLPYSVQWNVGVERALGRDQSISLSYVGASGHRLLQEQRRNFNKFNPNFGDVVYFPGGITSNYQAMQVRFQRTLSRGVEALASYTWAHSIDYGSTDPAFPLVRGNSDLDVRHNLEAALTWDLPQPSHSGLKNRLFRNWEIDGRILARTGFPVNLGGNFFFDTVTGEPYYSGVNLIPNKPLYFRNPGVPGGRMFNGGQEASDPAFSLPAGSNQGNAPRNLVRGFAANQFNLALRRNFHLTSRLNLEFGADAFNVLNHPNFGYVDPYLSDLLFGQATEMLNQSFGSSGALYEQGGPRSLQISIRLSF